MSETVEIVRHSMRTNYFRCRCAKRPRIHFRGSAREAICANCSALHVRGQHVPLPLGAVITESVATNDAPYPMPFRAVEGSAIRISGGDGMYGVERLLTFACGRCSWIGPEHEVIAHYDKHMEKLAQTG